MLEVNICKVLLDILKDQPFVEKVANFLSDAECELKALIQGMAGFLCFDHLWTDFPLCKMYVD